MHVIRPLSLPQVVAFKAASTSATERRIASIRLEDPLAWRQMLQAVGLVELGKTQGEPRRDLVREAFSGPAFKTADEVAQALGLTQLQVMQARKNLQKQDGVVFEVTSGPTRAKLWRTVQ